VRIGRSAVSLAFTAIAAVSLGVSLYLAYQAGCAGSLKSGVGEPLRTLELERFSMNWAIAGLFCGSLSILSSSHASWLVKLIGAVLLVTIGGAILWFIAVQVEISGVRDCF
jgi:hypothetical protein